MRNALHAEIARNGIFIRQRGGQDRLIGKKDSHLPISPAILREVGTYFLEVELDGNRHGESSNGEMTDVQRVTKMMAW